MEQDEKRQLAPWMVEKIPAAQCAVAADPLPRTRPVEGSWLTVDEAYGGQIALKARLMAERRAAVFWDAAASDAALAALNRTLLTACQVDGRFAVSGRRVTCPDRRQVDISGLSDWAKVLQEDLVLIEKRGEAHCLTAALLCFPASWMLSEKAGRSLGAIHGPVADYTDQIGRRVDRLFDGVREGQPIWRANRLAYDDPALHQPRAESDPARELSGAGRWDRSERQTILRLPQTTAVLFAIHTAVAPKDP